ncbi:hypothetical protein OHA59_30355 [Streptomyces sp. NBC_01589]|uniref:hypothetical protein n=1 Tax=Streptomyces sp. NBC_01589 TaxID=2975886 RepID=UPI00386DAC79
MSLDMMTRAQAEGLPRFEATDSRRMGSLYLWEDVSDANLTFFVRCAAENELGCLADVFVIENGRTTFVDREMFICEGGKLRLLEEA